MVCIGFVCASCIFAALNAVMSNSSRSVLACTRRSIRALRPVCLFESFRCPKRTVALPDAARNDVAVPASTVDDCLDNTRQQYGSDAEPANTISWSDVSNLADRCFFVLHILMAIATVIGYWAYGYYTWQTYDERPFTDAQWQLICYEGRIQNDIHLNAICSERCSNC
jgi:hypothetical protein